MKKLTLTLTIFTAFCALVYAGPEPYSGKDMKQVAPMPPSCPDWNGFYVGGFAGYKFGTSDTSLELGGLWVNVFPDDLNAAGSRDTDPSGPEVGTIIGFNHQFNKWVVGVEASAAYLWADDSNHFENVVGSGGLYDLNTSLESSYLFTFGPRIGYTFCKWLPYVTGGLAVGDIDFHQEFIAVGAPTARQGDSANEAQIGWMVGGGLEYAVTDHWRVRGQYQYIDLGDVDFDSVFTNSGVPAVGFTGHHEASLREHNVSFALIYGF